MKRILRISGVVLFGVAAALALACGEDDEQNPGGPIWARFHRGVKGTVTQLDNGAKTMSMKTKKGADMTFVWDDKTKVDGTLAMWATVGVRYKKQADGHYLAQKIKVFGPEPAAGGAPSTTTETQMKTETKMEGATPSTTTETKAKTTTETPKKK